MILFEHHFWGHVPWSATVLMPIFWRPLSCNSEICQSQVPICIKHKVFWLDVPMNYPFIVDSFKCLYQTCQEELGCIVRKFPNM